jgi:hypothetical protein
MTPMSAALAGMGVYAGIVLAAPTQRRDVQGPGRDGLRPVAASAVPAPGVRRLVAHARGGRVARTGDGRPAQSGGDHRHARRRKGDPADRCRPGLAARRRNHAEPVRHPVIHAAQTGVLHGLAARASEARQ